MFISKDPVIYDELWDVVGGAAVVKGQAAVIQDVFGFYFTAGAIGDTICLHYRNRQVEADKAVGTGEDILRGDRLYWIVATQLVSATHAGTLGTDSYFCGWAKKSASATDDIVLMNFDGTHYDQTDY